MKILILGVSGMLGHVLFTKLAENPSLEVFGAVWCKEKLARVFPGQLLERVTGGLDADNPESLMEVVAGVSPEVVINCIGIVKQNPLSADPLPVISVNALFPHRLALVCISAGARLIHFSTDCVFDGTGGNYHEAVPPNPTDLYGRSKALGEIDYPLCLTLRTSFIGHELFTRWGLLEWFLSQEVKVRGYSRTVFSGFTTVELAWIIDNAILPRHDLKGICHLSAKPISKYDLLNLIKERYGSMIEIESDDSACCDRSLDSSLFHRATGYLAPPWTDMIDAMYRDYKTSPHYERRF